MDDFERILDQLFHNVMETDDWKTDGDHELEVSPFVFDCLQAGVRFNHDFNLNRPVNEQLAFRGMFKIKFVMESVPDVVPVGGPDFPGSAKNTIPEFLHVALRVECRNGRFSYFDWDKNRESMK